MNRKKIACGAASCAFGQIPEHCGHYEDHVLLLPKSKTGMGDPAKNDLSSIDPDEQFSIYRSHPCDLSYEEYLQYMKRERYAKGEHMFKEDDTIRGYVQRNGGLSLSNFKDHKTYYTALIEVLRGIGIMNDNMFFHLDIHDQNIVIDNKGNVRIIDFGSAINGLEDPIRVVNKTLKYMKFYIPDLINPEELETTEPSDLLWKYRLYVDFGYGLIGLLQEIEDLPVPIKRFMEQVIEGKLDAKRALPLYIKAVEQL